MLRMILGQGRRRNERRREPPEDESLEEAHDDLPVEDNTDDLEPWLDCIKRVTHSVENSLQTLRIKTWVEQARKRKWKWAAEIYSGVGEKKWTHIALEWHPQIHSDLPRPQARRRPARPNARWTDELRNFFTSLQSERQWKDVCSNPDYWKTHESDFVNRDVK